MATRAKYELVRGGENNETKLDTDIIMRFSPTYGNHSLIQVAMSHAHSPSSSGKAKTSSRSRLLRNSWTRLFGLLK